MEDTLVPKQEKGGHLDVVADITLDTLEEAEAFFEVAKTRLLAVNLWDEVCNAPSATFRLVNHKNQELIGMAKKDDYMRINIPGPGTKAGKGFDWVRIESIVTQQTENAELLSITVRPCNHPLMPHEPIAHFFTASASSTFQVKRTGKKVSAAVHGRNEVVNNRSGHILDRIRNTMVGLGAKFGISYPQWKLLVEGIVRK